MNRVYQSFREGGRGALPEGVRPAKLDANEWSPMKRKFILICCSLAFWVSVAEAAEVTCRELLQVDYELASFEFYRQHRGLNVEGRSTAHLLEILTPFLEALAHYQRLEKKIQSRFGASRLEGLLERVCDRDTHLRLAQERANALKWVEGRPPKIPTEFNRMRAQITEGAQQLALMISREVTARQKRAEKRKASPNRP